MKKQIKKILSIFLVVVLMMFCLTACSTTLSGTYTNKEGVIEQSFTFEKDGVVKVSAFDIDVEGTYVIEDGQIIITYSLFNFSYSLEKSFEKKGNTIIIDGTEFVKE